MDGMDVAGETRTFLCKTGDIPETGVLRVVITGYPPLAVYSLDGGFYATEDICSHGNASLSGGFIEGGTIICPLHFGSFDIRTGEPVDAPCSREIETYPITLHGNDLLVSRRHR
jgi:nitrite reductase/ring-hydroxylating ferredoxin subunit